MQVPLTVLTHSQRAAQFIRTLLTVLLPLFFISPSIQAASVAESTPGGPVELASFLKPVSAPDTIVRGDQSSNDQWYKLRLTLSHSLNSDWLLVFRRTPHKKLDVFTPTENGYRLNSLGSGSRHSKSDPRILKLALSDNRIHDLYIRVNKSEPNRLTPSLWPQSLYTLNEYKNQAFSASLLALLLLFLVGAAAVMIYTRHQSYLLLTSHLLATTALVLMHQGEIFRMINWSGDPGLWVLTMTVISLVSALACYKNLGLLALYTPKTDRLMLWLCFMSVGFVATFFLTQQIMLLNAAFLMIALTAAILTASLLTIFAQGVRPAKLALPVMATLFFALFSSWVATDWPRAIPNQPELALLSLQSLMITGLYWVNRSHKHRQAISINLVTTHNDKRRVFDTALRKHLQAPTNALMDEKAIRERILETLDAVMPGTPSMILVRKKDYWDISSHYPKAAQILKSSIDTIEDELISIINSDQEHHVRLEDRNGVKYWVFLLHTEENHHTLLVVSPGSQRKKSLKWQQITDISTHARTLFQANQQTRFWKLQASLDSLTGILNRRAFVNEANELVHRKDPEQAQSCLIFIDIDDFKQINDRFGHPAGDKVLSDLANRLRKELRQQDLIARYGGEEFVALLPETDAVRGVQIAERLRNSASLYEGGPVPLSISLGIAATGPQTDTLDKLLKEADDALYEAKNTGKNKVCRAPSCRDIRLS
ncbi:diguanylate cyclase [Endozoicomonas arenosclerae]|uniref:diguanylate cyclase n=1 Tax=Endozoicomonas arenosclerae TaxID=1633495 RepID=UPI000785D5A9|nr:diguanylate cyclase [Endozoicomonas arenosclerae]